MGIQSRRFTADDLWEIQGSDPNVHGWELVNGELVEVSPANLPHGRIQSLLAHLFWNHVDRHGGGVVYTEGGFVLQVPGDSERVRGPDVAFVSSETPERAGGEPAKGYARMRPDLAAEVFSPSNPTPGISGDARSAVRVRTALRRGAPVQGYLPHGPRRLR
jgi:Uma2 family endonuclease